MSASKPQERGYLIRTAKARAQHCQTCDPTPKRKVSAEELWKRLTARSGSGFVHIRERGSDG